MKKLKSYFYNIFNMFSQFIGLKLEDCKIFNAF